MPVERESDEISISDILAKLRQRRGLLVVVPGLLVMAGIVYILASATTATLPTVYYLELHAIEKGRYPSGARFSPQDLVAGEILAEVAGQTELSAADLRNAINVEFGSPATRGIIAAYERRVSARNLSATDIERFTERFKDKLRRANERGVRIALFHEDLGLTSDAGASVAVLIPNVWSKIFSERYRIFSDIAPSAVVLRSMEGLKTTSQILDAQDQLDRLRAGLKKISTDARLSAITNSAGQTADDILLEVDRFAALFFRPIYSYAFRRTNQISETYIRKATYSMMEIDKQIESLNDTVNKIVRFRGNGKVRAVPEPAANGGSIQLGEDALTQIIGLANRSSLTDYLTQVLDQRHELFVERARIETRLAWANGQPDDRVIDDAFHDRARDGLNDLLSSYHSLFETVHARLRDRYTALYRPVAAPFVQGSRVPPKAGLVLALAVTGGFFIAVFVALVLPDARPSRRSSLVEHSIDNRKVARSMPAAGTMG